MNKERELLERVLTSELWSVQEELQSEIRELLAQPEQEPNKQVPVQKILEEFPLLDDEGLDEEVHHCEWVLQQERKRLHAMISKVLAQPEQEPVAWRKWDGYGFYFREYDTGGEPLYLAPQSVKLRSYAQAMKDLKREPLSEDKVIVPEWMISQDERQSFVIGIRFAEKMHGIGGGE
jgi:hypothetical protein